MMYRDADGQVYPRTREGTARLIRDMSIVLKDAMQVLNALGFHKTVEAGAMAVGTLFGVSAIVAGELFETDETLHAKAKEDQMSKHNDGTKSWTPDEDSRSWRKEYSEEDVKAHLVENGFDPELWKYEVWADGSMTFDLWHLGGGTPLKLKDLKRLKAAFKARYMRMYPVNAHIEGDPNNKVQGLRIILGWTRAKWESK